MIDFGGTKDYPVGAFAPRLRALRRTTASPSCWPRPTPRRAAPPSGSATCAVLLRRSPWIRGVFWSQLPSRGKVQQAGAGVVDWDVQRVPAAAAQLRGIIRDGLRGGG